jgi:hypothetical protein
MKGEIMKHLLSKLQSPWDLNSRWGFILMAPIKVITIVKFTEADGISPHFVKRWKPQKISTV